MQRLTWVALVALSAWSATTFGQAPAAGVTVFHGARLIVGDGRAPIENAAFVVNGAGFVAVGSAADVRVPAGGARVSLAGKTASAFGASWGANDTIIFSQGLLGLWRVSAAGGTPELIAAPDTGKGELKYLLSRILPGDRTVIFTVSHTPLPTWEDTEIVAQSLQSAERKVLVRHSRRPAVPDGPAEGTSHGRCLGDDPRAELARGSEGPCPGEVEEQTAGQQATHVRL
jgi:hypothetical protein